MRTRGFRSGEAGILVLPVLIWTAAFAVPLAAVLFRALIPDSGFRSPIWSPYFSRVLRFTIGQAGLSTLFSVLFGLPGAYLIARYRFPGRRFMKSLATVPFVLPPILVVLGFILVFGNSGLLNSLRKVLAGNDVSPWRILYSLKAIILAHVFYNFPITLRVVGDAWSTLPESSSRAARSLGAGPLRTFLAIDLPVLAPTILASAAITFLYCFMSFAVVLILGGGPELSTLEVEVYRLIKQLDLRAGSVLAVLETALAFGLLLLYSRGESVLRRNAAAETGAGSPRPLIPLGGRRALPALLYFLPVAAVILAPLASIAVHSFIHRATRTSPLTFTTDHWLRLLGGGRVSTAVPLLAVARTLGLAAAAAFTSTLTASLAAWYSSRHRGWKAGTVDSMMFLPMGVSSIILGLGYLLITLKIPDYRIARLAALLGAHTMMALPFAYRIIKGRLNEISHRIPQAARAAGAGPVRTLFTIELPMVRETLISAFVFSMAISAGELNAVIILAPPGFTTIPLAIYRMIGSYDIFGACALGTLLIAVSTAGFLALDRYGDSPA